MVLGGVYELVGADVFGGLGTNTDGGGTTEIVVPTRQHDMA